MVVATATPDGRPSLRTVLLRGVDERGFVFFTNYESRKGRELAGEPERRAAVLLGAAGAAGGGDRHGGPGAAVRDRGVLPHPPAGQPARGLGEPAVRGRAVPRGARRRASPSWSGAGRRAWRSRRRRTGAGCGWRRRPSSSGRAGRPGCTTGSGTAGPTRAAGSAGRRRVAGRAARPVTGRFRRIAIDTTPLRHPAYRRLFVGQGVSFVGFQVTAVAVPVQVYDDHPVVVLGRHPRPGRAGAAGRLRAVGRARSPTRWTGASCCWSPRLVTWLVTLALLAPGAGRPGQPRPDPGAGRRAVGRLRGHLADPQRDHPAAAGPASWCRPPTR